MTARKTAVHTNPVWRDRGDSLIVVKLEEGHAEELCTRHLSGNRYEVCCIPFFAFDVALGDVVEATPQSGRHVFRRVVKQAGRYVFRIWFGGVIGQSVRPEVIAEVTSALSHLGCEQEWSADNLLAVAVAADRADPVAAYLSKQQAHKHLIYDSGRS